jgi:hypothetical protein
VQALGRGEVQPGRILEKRPLPPSQLACSADRSAPSLHTDCGGN